MKIKLVSRYVFINRGKFLIFIDFLDLKTPDIHGDVAEVGAIFLGLQSKDPLVDRPMLNGDAIPFAAKSQQ